MANVQKPIDYDILGIGPFGAIPRANIDYFDGPEVYGVSPDKFLQWEYRWVAWFSSTGLRVSRRSPGWQATEIGGSVAEVYPNTVRSYLSACLDKDAHITAVTELGNGYWELRKQETGSEVTYGPFYGKTPVAFMTGVLLPEATDAEVVVFYIKPGGKTVFIRFERENFTVEHVLVTGLTRGFTRLTKVDRIGMNIFIWGISGTDRPSTVQLVVKSEDYPPWPALESDSGTVGASVIGIYELVVVAAATQSDDATAGADVLGTYESIVVSPADQSDDSTVAADVFGSYTDVVQAAAGETDSATLEISISGDYEQIIKPTSGLSDSATVGVNVSGTYELV